MNNKNVVVIMAGGLGKRMESKLPKVLHLVQNKPMLVHVIQKALLVNPEKIYIIVGKYKQVIRDTLYLFFNIKMFDYQIEFITQPESLGTGHAIQCCLPVLSKYINTKVLVLSGDTPLISYDTIIALLKSSNKSQLLITDVEEPTGYGRIIKDENNKFSKIVEEKDCDDSQKKITTINSGIYVFDSEILCKYLPFLKNNNSQKEYYLTDVIEIINNQENLNISENNIIDMYLLPKEKQLELVGVNTKTQLLELNAKLCPTLTKPTILVTGGIGFIGSHTCVELISKYNLIIIDNLYNSSLDVLDKIKQLCKEYNTKDNNITFYPIDLCDEYLLQLIFQLYKPEYVIHFAGYKCVPKSISEPIKYYHNNLLSTINLLNVMEENDCFNLVFSSSSTIYGDNKSPFTEESTIGSAITCPYGQTKFMIEQILSDVCVSSKKWSIIALRYFNPIGAHSSGLLYDDPNGIPNNIMPYIVNVAKQNNLNDIYLGPEYNELKLFGTDWETPDGTCLRDYVHVVDLAKGHVKALEKINKLTGYNVYNLGTEIPTSVSELINTFGKVNNVKIPIKLCDKRVGDRAIVYCNTTKAEKELGWKSEKTIADSCRDCWNSVIKNM
jgi:UDP-glucose 4-epimerase